jgi:membrane fusion protein (multidrug efflux system)
MPYRLIRLRIHAVVRRGSLMIRQVVISVLALALVGCTSARGDPQASRAAGPPPPAVAVTPAVQHTVPVYEQAVAQTVALQTVDLRAQIGGTIEEVRFKEGTEVKKGQVLFVIDQRPYLAALESAEAQLATARAALQQAQEETQLAQAKAQLVALQAPLVNAQQNVARDRYLVAQGAIAQQQLDNDLATMKAAAANVNAQEAVVRNTALSQEIAIAQAQASVQQAQASVRQARLNLLYTTVRAPVDGVVGLLDVDQGNLVAANQLLATMSSVDPMIAQFNVSEVTYLGLVKGATAAAAPAGQAVPSIPRLQLILADGSVYPEAGTFRTLNRSVDPQSGTITMQALFPNPRRLLRPGMYAQVRAQVGEQPNAVLVPQIAAQEVQGVEIVYVVGSDDRVAVRTLTTAGTYGPFLVVLKGVAPGERVIVEGIQKVQPGIKVVPTVRPAPPVPASATP